MSRADARYLEVHLAHANLRRNGHRVLKDLSWIIRPGERWVLAGGNGAGKTQLLKLIAGTLEPLIDKDFALGQMFRVNQTPTTVFHCKGQTYPYPGVMTYDTVKQFLEQLLSQK